MAYNLMVSKDLKNDKSPKPVSTLDSSDYDAIQRLVVRTKSNFLIRLLDPYKDQMFGAQDLSQAQNQLHEMMTTELDPDERYLAEKLLTIIEIAVSRAENLYGVAD